MYATDHRAHLLATLERHGLEHALEDVWSKLHALVEELVASDALAKASIDRARGQPYQVPSGGMIQLGFVLYWLKYDQAEIDKYVAKLPKLLQDLWKGGIFLLLTAHPPTVTPEDYEFMKAQLGGEGIIAPDGEILGTGEYQGADAEWLWAFFNYLINLIPLPDTVAPFHPSGSAGPYVRALPEGTVKIAIIGDWGTGPFDGGGGYDPASDVLSTVRALKPDYLVHLGDVYYCGTEDRIPMKEEQQHLLDTWPDMSPERSFTLNSNHEMYGGAFGYFDVALGRTAKEPTPFQHQNGLSYFALTRGDWAFVGLDAAYFDPSTLYMTGGLGDPDKNPQYAFLRQLAAKHDKLVLFTHQTAMSTDGTQALQLWKDVTETAGIPASKIGLWYWGHIHLGLVYGGASALGALGVPARCVGHSAIPIGAPWGLGSGAGKPIEWLSNQPIGEGAYANRVANGFAMLTVTDDGVSEAIYNAGSTTPAWTSDGVAAG